MLAARKVITFLVALTALASRAAAAPPVHPPPADPAHVAEPAPAQTRLALVAEAPSLTLAGAPGERKAAPPPAILPTHHWSYEGAGSPEHWAELSPDNAACSTGAQQSPVDLGPAIAARVQLPAAGWSTASGGMIINTGHTLQVDVAGGGGVQLDGREFALKQFHFHHPSEHTIDGKSFPLEAHFVHVARDGRIAVTAVLFEEGAGHPALDPVWATAPVREGKSAVAFPIDATAFRPASGAAYRYEGSLTTPPCTESVSWTVFAQPVTASKGQLAAFASLFPDNHRPVQPLNRRYVLRSE
jgi:carbonic anhydrase